MEHFTAQTFNIPELKGISKQNIEEHLKLYAGYIKHANLILNEIVRNQSTGAEEVYEMSEIQRRFAFEFGGIRNHELYFSLLEGGASSLSPESALSQKIALDFGSIDKWRESFSKLFSIRGPGWAMLGLDRIDNTLRNYWIDEQHIGHLPAVAPIFGIDFWEHAFVADYQPSGKLKYAEDFMANVNWSVAEARFAKMQ